MIFYYTHLNYIFQIRTVARQLYARQTYILVTLLLDFHTQAIFWLISV